MYRLLNMAAILKFKVVAKPILATTNTMVLMKSLDITNMWELPRFFKLLSCSQVEIYEEI